MPLEPGQKLSHYRLVEKIGEGGMGVVWRARDEKLRRDVALKVLPAELVEDPERRRRLLREARSAAAINHPNIGTVYEVDEADGTVFIAMELVEGETLRSLLDGKPLAIPEALRIAAEMAEGLAAAHQAEVIHRGGLVLRVSSLCRSTRSRRPRRDRGVFTTATIQMVGSRVSTRSKCSSRPARPGPSSSGREDRAGDSKRVCYDPRS